MEDQLIVIEEDRTFTAGRVVAAAALVAGIGLAAWSAYRATRKPQAHVRVDDLRRAAARAWEHPERIARGNGKAVGRKFFETFASTAAKALAGRTVLALFETALRRPGSDVEILDFPVERIEPLPA